MYEFVPKPVTPTASSTMTMAVIFRPSWSLTQLDSVEYEYKFDRVQFGEPLSHFIALGRCASRRAGFFLSFFLSFFVFDMCPEANVPLPESIERVIIDAVRGIRDYNIARIYPNNMRSSKAERKFYSFLFCKARSIALRFTCDYCSGFFSSSFSIEAGK